MREFRPHPLAIGGHRQTILGFWCRRRLRWTLPTEDVIVEAGDRLLLRASWQDGERKRRPALLIVHGLGGSDGATYVVALGRHAFARGWHVMRMNLRGAGDSIAVCSLLYNAGLDSDLVAALERIARMVPRVAVAGFSLGGNLALLALARSAARLPPGLIGVASVSPPLDLAACAAALERPGNRLYQAYFMGNLRRAYRELQALRPDLYEAGRERETRSVREYDERITAPYAGYRDADEYYARSSAGPRLAGIGHRALILSAQDDPMVPTESVAHWALPASGCVRREILRTGGHVGFVAPTRAPGRFFAAERVTEFLETSEA